MIAYISCISAGSNICRTSSCPILRIVFKTITKVPAKTIWFYLFWLIPFSTLIIKRINIGIASCCFCGVAVNCTSVTCEHFQVIAHDQFISYFYPITSVIGIIEISLINIIRNIIPINIIKFKINFKIYFVSCHIYFFNDSIIAFRNLASA